MECSNWKRVIYEWIESTKLISITGESVEHTNINQFYDEFRQKLTAFALKETSVIHFLQAHYDTFEFHLDDTNEISSLDYIYIYSLLLHFSCVKYPDQHFHKLCQSLDNGSQACFQKFFQFLLENANFDRDTIRAAISAATPTIHESPVDSPVRATQPMILPTTPRTLFCEDSRREMILLKAQLDSERYERNVLEMLLKQTEQKLERMVLSQRRYMEEIKSLKNDLLSRDTENHSPNKNFSIDQKNHRLQKELLDKEERIIQLQLTIDNLMDDNKSAGEKLAFNEKQISQWIDKSRDLEQTIMDIRAELDDRSEKIKCLQETNTELLNFIRESRGSVPPGIESLNASSCEALDFSFARFSNSADVSTSSPENLGRFVVDVQLKEREMENSMLRDKLEMLKHDFNRIATEIRNYCNLTPDLEPLNPSEPVDEYSLPLKQFEHCKNYFVDKLAVSEEFVKNLSSENNTLKERINELGDMQDELRATISKLEHDFMIKERVFDSKISELSEVLLTKTSENTNLFERIEKQLVDNESLSVQIDDITKAKANLENDMVVSRATITELKELCESRYAEIENIGCKNDLLRAENKDLVSAVAQLESTLDKINRTNAAENDRLTSEIVELSRIVSSITDENTAAEDKIQQLTEKVFQSGEEAHELRDRINELSEREDRLIEDHQNLMEKLGDVSAERELLALEIIDLAESKYEIAERFNKTIAEHAIIKSEFDTRVRNLTESVAEAEIEKAELKSEVEQISANNLEIVTCLRNEISELNSKLEASNMHSLELVENLTKTSAQKSELLEKIGKLEETEILSLNRIAEIVEDKTELEQQVAVSKCDITELRSVLEKLQLDLENANQTNECASKSNVENLEIISKLKGERNDLISRIDQANKEISNLSSRIAELDQMVQEMSDKNVGLTNEKLDLAEKLTKCETEIQSLLQSNETVAKSNSDYIETITKLEEERCNLNNRLEEAKAEISSSVSRIQELHQLAIENSKLQSQMKDEIETAKRANESISIEKIELTDTVAKFEAIIQALQQTNEQATNSNSEYIETIGKLEQERRNLSEQVEEANLKIENATVRIHELNQTIDKKNANNSLLINEKSELTDKLNTLKVDYTNSEAQILQLEVEIRTIAQAKESADQLNSQHVETISKMQEEGCRLGNQLVEANTEMDRVLSRIKELDQIVAENSHTQTQLNGEIAKLKIAKETLIQQKIEVIEKFENEIEHLNQINDSMVKSNSKYVENISKLEEERQNLTSQLKNAMDEIETTSTKVQELNKMLGEASFEISNLKNGNEMVTKEKSALTEKLDQLEIDLGNSETQIVELRDELRSLILNNESAIKTIHEHVQTISKLQEQNSDLSIQIDQVNAEILCSTSRIEDLERVVDESSRKIVELSNEKMDLSVKLIESQTNFGNAKTQINELTIAIHDLNQIKELATKSNLEHVDLISRLEEEKNNLCNELDKSLAEIEASAVQLKKLDQIVEESRNEILSLKTAKDMITKDKLELIEHIDKFKDENTSLKTEFQTLSAANEATINLNSEYKENISKLQEEIDSLSEQLRETKLENERSTLQIQELTKILDENSTKIVGLTSEKATLIENIDKLKAKCANTEVRVTELTTKIQVLSETCATVSTLNTEHVQTISKLQEERCNLNEQLCNTNAELAISISRIQEVTEIATKEKTEFSKKVAELQTMCDISETRITELTKEMSVTISARDDIIHKLETQICELTVQKDEFVQKLRDSTIEVQTLSQSTTSITKSNHEYVDKVSNLEKANEALVTELETSKITNSRISDEIEAAKTQIAQLKESQISEVVEYENNLSGLRKERDELIQTADKLKDESSQLSARLKNSEIRVEEALQTNSDLRDKIEHLAAEKLKIETRLSRDSNTFTAEIEKISAEKTKLNEEVLALKNEIRQTIQTTQGHLNEVTTDFSEKITKLEKSSEILVSELEAAKATNSLLGEEIDNSKTKVQELIESRNSEIDKYEIRLSDLNKQSAELNEIVIRLKNDSSNLSARLADSEARIQETLGVNSELQTKIEQLATEKLEIQNERDQQTSKFTAEITKITAENSKLGEKVSVLETEVKQLVETNESRTTELSTKNFELATEIAELRTNAEMSRDAKLRLTEEIFTSESKIKELTVENKALADKMLALNSEIRVEKDRMYKKVEQLTHEIDNLVANYETIQKEKADLEVDLKITQSELSNLKDSHSDAHSTKLALIEKEQTISSLEYNVNKLQKDKLEKDKYIENLDQRISQKDMEIADMMRKLQDSCEKDRLLNAEKELNEKFTQDIAILKAKLYKHREVSKENEKKWNAEKEQLMAAIEEQKSAEERITENRLELVGKLEKMKTKMKTLYNEEMVKVKTKHENEMSDLQKQAREKITKYDSHIEKLSKQIYQLNERNLGLEKDNKFLRTKIDFLEVNTDAATGSTMALNSLGSGGSRNLLHSTNLKMEDEEGEIFNNTYLTDLKTGGRISPTVFGGRDSVRFSELQQRNSQMPRHLRSTYAAQYGDQDIREEDLKDPINFEDSLCSLLYGGHRKKMSGVTAYQRPGPPTPTKNGGRKSLGTVTEIQTREVLKENNLNIPSRLSMTTGSGFGGGNKRNTPRGLKSLFSNSTSKLKDDLESILLENSIIARNKQLQQLLHQPNLTSTPRSRRYITRNHARLSGHFGISKATSKLNPRHLKMSPAIQSTGLIPSSTQQFSVYQQQSQYGEWRQSGTIIDSESCTSTSQTGSEFDEPEREQNTTLKSSLNSSGRRRSTKFTVKMSALTHTRNRHRMKSKENRLENFNRARRSINGLILRKSLLNRSASIRNEPEMESCAQYTLLNDLMQLSNQPMLAAKVNDGEPTSFAEFEKLTKYKVSEAPFGPPTTSTTIQESITKISRRRKSLYAGGVIINRKIPRQSIRIGGCNLLNPSYSNGSSNFDQTIRNSFANSSSASVVRRNLSQARLKWQHCDHRVKQIGIGIIGLLLILNLICAVKFLYF